MSIFEDTLDQYAANNVLSDCNIYYKFIFSFVTLIVNLFANSPIMPFFIFLFCTGLIVFRAKVSLKFFLTFMAVPAAFGFITMVFMAFFFGTGPHIWDLGIFGWGITADGLDRGILIFFRVLGGVSALEFLILTTPVNRVFSIMPKLHIPQILTDLAILMYRDIFLFLDVTETMYNSQVTRLGYRDYRSWMSCLASLAGMIFIRTWEQGEVSYKALASRGYNGRLSMIGVEDKLSDITIRNWILLVLFEGIIIVGIYYTGTFNLIPNIIQV